MTTAEHRVPPVRRGGRIVTAVAGVLVALAGIAEFAAMARRWGHCVGDYESLACLRWQDHRYDYFLPTGPWTAIPGTAALTGLAFLLVAGALLLAAGRAPTWRVVWVGTAACVLAVGLLNLASGLIGTALPVNGPAYAVWFVVGPVAGAVLVLRSLTDPAADLAVRLLAAVAVVIGLRGSVVEYVLVVPPYLSHDTAPFRGGLGAAALVVLGVALVVVAARQGGRSSRVR